MNEILSIEWNNLTPSQFFYVNSVVMPAITEFLKPYVGELLELKDAETFPLCSRRCKECVYEHTCNESEEVK